MSWPLSQRLKYYWRFRWGIALKYGAPVFDRLQQARHGRRIAAIPLPSNPLFVIGHWRTGTTLAHELLSLDSQFRSPSTYEVFNPRNFLVTESFFKEQTRALLPKTRPQDRMPADWDLPQEDEFALVMQRAPSLYTFGYDGTFIGTALDRVEQSLVVDTLPEAQRLMWMRAWTGFLRTLLARREGRLLLKSPTHTFRLPLIEQIFPAAQYIYMVRNPATLVPSTTGLIKAMMPAPAQPTMIAMQTKLLAWLHERVEETARAIPRDRFVTVRYEDLVTDPTGQVSLIYTQLGLGEFDPVRPLIEASMRARSEYQPNRHVLSDEIAEDIRTNCRPYAERHGYSPNGG